MNVLDRFRRLGAFPDAGRTGRDRRETSRGGGAAVSDALFALMDEWGPEKVVCVSDRRSEMRRACPGQRRSEWNRP